MAKTSPDEDSETIGKQCKGAFRVATATGPKVVLPPRYLDDIKSDDRFSFAHEMAKVGMHFQRKMVRDCEADPERQAISVSFTGVRSICHTAP